MVPQKSEVKNLGFRPLAHRSKLIANSQEARSWEARKLRSF
jgi:hypothetical protein